MRPGIAYWVSHALKVICIDLKSDSSALIQQATQLKNEDIRDFPGGPG